MKRVLIITYYWPPAGGVEVHRVVKFCKYLIDAGWTPEILTVESGKHTQLDEGLARDIAGVDTVTRTASLEPHFLFNLLAGKKNAGGASTKTPSGGRRSWMHTIGEYIRLNMFIPDARIGWYPFARKAGIKRLSAEKPDLIFSTAPPYTVHLVARSLSRKFKIPWVADFRDPWVENYAYNTVPRFPWVRAINQSMESRILRQADAVICATPGQQAIQSGKVDPQLRDKFHLITNGYDGAPPENLARTEQFTLSYFGTLSAQRLPPSLLPALKNMCDHTPGFTEVFRFRLIGRFPPEVESRIRESLPESCLEIRHHIPHQELAPLMRQEQVMLVLVDAVPYNELIIPAKIFEILPTGNPMLAIGPVTGDAANMIRSTGSGVTCAPDDQAAIEHSIQQWWDQWTSGTLGRGTRRYPEFEREQLTARLADIFNRLTSPTRQP